MKADKYVHQNLEKEKIKKPNPRETAPPRVEPRRALPLVFVAETQLQQISQWCNWLIDQGMPGLEKFELRTMKCGKYGYALPGHWPPRQHQSESARMARVFSANDLTTSPQDPPGKPKCEERRDHGV